MAARTGLSQSKEIRADLEVHLVCDNATHKTPAVKNWLLAHPRFHMHFTPTSSSWLNLGEHWFAELTAKRIRRGVHKTVQALEKDIDVPRVSWSHLAGQMMLQSLKEAPMPRSYSPEFRREVLDLVDAGRPIRQIAHDLGISEQTIYVWRRQHLIDAGQRPGPTSEVQAELVAARRRIAELEAELAIHLRAAELIGKVVPPKDAPRPWR
jgi:transposase